MIITKTSNLQQHYKVNLWIYDIQGTSRNWKIGHLSVSDTTPMSSYLTFTNLFIIHVQYTEQMKYIIPPLTKTKCSIDHITI